MATDLHYGREYWSLSTSGCIINGTGLQSDVDHHVSTGIASLECHIRAAKLTM